MHYYDVHAIINTKNSLKPSLLNRTLKSFVASWTHHYIPIILI